MDFDRKKSKIVRKFIVITLALALAVPVSMMFSSNVTTENVTDISTSSASEFETVASNPVPLEIDNPWDAMPSGLGTFDYHHQPLEFNMSECIIIPEPGLPENVTYEEPELPVFEHIEEPYNITLVTMNSPTGSLYESERRPIQVILKNKADHNIFNINVDIYYRLDEGESVFLTDLFYGCIPSVKEQKNTFTWEPEKGTHYLTLNISYIDNGVEEVNEEEFGFHILPQNAEEVEGASPREVTGYEEWTGYKWLEEDLLITSTGHLVLIDCELEMICSEDGQYSITVEKGTVPDGGILEVLGDSLIIAQNSDLTYGFEVYGTLKVLGTPTVGPTIQWMYGDPLDETVPAGIQLYRSSAALFEYATIRDGKSHNIYADGAEFTVTGCEISGAQSTGIACGIYATNGAEMHVGGNTQIFSNGHSGIYSNVSSVDIDYVTVRMNPEDGVAVIGDMYLQPGEDPEVVLTDSHNFEPWGRPLSYTPGSDDIAYYIWLDDIPDKNTWHIRWSGDGTGYTFDGVITLDGDISYFERFGEIDEWGVSPTTITFTDLEGPIVDEGFDFRFDGAKIIFDIDILIGGTPIDTEIHVGEMGYFTLEADNIDAKLRLYQMRPPIIHGLKASDVSRGLSIFRRALGQIQDLDIQAGRSYGIYLWGTRQTQKSNGYVESKERDAIHITSYSDHNTVSDFELVSGYSNAALIAFGSTYNKFYGVKTSTIEKIGNGFILWHGANCNTFQSCTASNCLGGFVTGYCRETRFIDCVATNCWIGIALQIGFQTRVDSCTLKGNEAGLYAGFEFYTSIENTVISENIGQGMDWVALLDTFGMAFVYTRDITIRDCEVIDNFGQDPGDVSGGVVVIGSNIGLHEVIIERTEIKGNDYGIYSVGATGGITKETRIDLSYSIVAGNRLYGIYSYLSVLILDNNMIGGEFTITSVENETVHGPTFEGETGPIYLANGNIINCTMYVDVAGEWMLLQEGIEYTLNYTTGEINTSPIEPFEAGWTFYAYYNYSIDTGDSNNYGVYGVQSSTQIIGNTISSNDEDGIYIDNEGDYSLISTIEDNTFSGNRRGIYISNAFATITDNNKITFNRGSGIVLENAEGDISWNTIKNNHRPRPPPEEELTGIEVLGCNGVWIHNNNVSYNGANIYLYESTNINIEWNKMVDEIAVILIYPTPPPPRGIYSISSQMTASNNEIWGTVIGIHVDDADGTTVVQDNKIYPIEDGQAAVGVYLESASVHVEQNIFDGIGTGIYCADNSNAMITSNTIINGGPNGIHCEWSSPTITDNTISGNTGWGIFCEFGAPANAGEDGDILIADNLNLGDNELGRIKQVWSVQIQVLSGGTPQDGVLVEVIPFLETIPILSGYTDADGLTDSFIATQYIVENGGIVNFKNPHDILCDGIPSASLDFEDNGIYVVEI